MPHLSVEVGKYYRVWCIVLALSVAPDADFLGWIFLPAHTFSRWFVSHRGITHSVGAAVLVASLVWLPTRHWAGSKLLWWLLLIGSIGQHGLVDWANGETPVLLWWPLPVNSGMSDLKLVPLLHRNSFSELGYGVLRDLVWSLSFVISFAGDRLPFLRSLAFLTHIRFASAGLFLMTIYCLAKGHS